MIIYCWGFRLMLEGIIVTMNCWKIKHDCLILNVILRVDSGVRGEKREDISIGGEGCSLRDKSGIVDINKTKWMR